jgi:hypothetical protein
MMNNPRAALNNVEFTSGLSPDSFDYVHSTGYFQMRNGRHAEDELTDGARFLGFGVPFNGAGGFDTGEEITPITELSALAENHQKVDLQGKGVGPRMYNSPQAAEGFTELPDWLGAYVFSVRPDRLLDLRDSEGSKISRIARHAGRMVSSAVGGLDKVVNNLHRSYGDTDAVLMTQPPRAAMRQSMERHQPDLEGVPAEFMIIRNSLVTLTRVGTVRRTA